MLDEGGEGLSPFLVARGIENDAGPMRLTQRALTGGTVGLSVWVLPDGSFYEAKITTAQYAQFVALGGEPPGRPNADAKWFMAFGGIPALDTLDGYASEGDCWDSEDADGNPTLTVATASGHNWMYTFEGGESGKYTSRGSRAITARGAAEFDTANFSKGTYLLPITAQVAAGPWIEYSP